MDVDEPPLSDRVSRPCARAKRDSSRCAEGHIRVAVPRGDDCPPSPSCAISPPTPNLVDFDTAAPPPSIPLPTQENPFWSTRSVHTRMHTLSHRARKNNNAKLGFLGCFLGMRRQTPFHLETHFFNLCIPLYSHPFHPRIEDRSSQATTRAVRTVPSRVTSVSFVVLLSVSPPSISPLGLPRALHQHV
jgi:hypothetical protein